MRSTMEKRKSSGADGDDRASKRQKTTTVPDAKAKAETPESTTEVGLAFLEQIRRTGDKSGRRVAKYFEELLPRDENKEYYKAIRMPISLTTIETKLRNGDFATLAELESYVKRMVQNAKDFYPRSSHVYDDAERVRKATSNFMVKHNPAYKTQGYSAFPTPIPDELLESEPETSAKSTPHASGEAEAGTEGEAEPEAEVVAKTGDDADGEDAAADNEDDQEEEEEDDDDDDDDDDDVAEPTSSRRQSSARAARDTPLRGRRKSTTERATPVSAKPDHEYADVPYKGLTFQQAQEKVVEEAIRRTDDEEGGYAYFEPFLNLPPRSLKDYFQLITNPLSLKKLQKLVKGVRSRAERSGVSEFKSWAAFEERASLLWENAYYYNEDGSEIVNMARELESMMRAEIRKAKEVVPEPPQQKIKIKMSQGVQETPAPGSKKITIHVANNRGSVDSPAPKTATSVQSDASVNAATTRSGSAAQAGSSMAASFTQLDKARSTSIASPSPSVAAGAKQEDSARASPALLQRPNGVGAGATLLNGTPAPAGAPNGQVNGAAVATNGAAAAAAPAVNTRPSYESKFRLPGRDPLIANLTLRTLPSINCADRRFEFRLPPHAKLTQRSVTVNIPPGQWRQHLIVSLAPVVQQQQRPFKLFVIANGATLGQAAPLPPVNAAADGTTSAAAALEANGKVYEVNLHPGVNVLQVQVIAGLPRDQKLPNGAEAELEKITVFANLMKY